jgi:hypothetical protein
MRSDLYSSLSFVALMPAGITVLMIFIQGLRAESVDSCCPTVSHVHALLRSLVAIMMLRIPSDSFLT